MLYVGLCIALTLLLPPLDELLVVSDNVMNDHSEFSKLVLLTSGSAMAEGLRDALSVEILQLQNIPFEN